jgi:crossover junction endodeoxyribonuclease RuvC
VIVGIDPGLKGAIALLDLKGQFVEAWAMPVLKLKVGARQRTKIDAVFLAAELDTYKDVVHVAVEDVHAMPKQGVTSMFSFGYNLGVVIGILAALSYPVTLVPPAVWKRDLRVNGGKDGSSSKATELWPRYVNQFSRPCDEGRAEAALIGYWLYTQSLTRV